MYFLRLKIDFQEDFLDKTPILHLNNQIVIFNSFNWAMLELNLIFYNLLFINFSNSSFLKLSISIIDFNFILCALVLIPIFSMARLGGKIFYETQSTSVKEKNFLFN